jgi:hypothetical protein
VKGNYVYFDLQGAYNSESINEMIQKEIMDLRDQQYYGWLDQSSYQSYGGYTGFRVSIFPIPDPPPKSPIIMGTEPPP